MDTNVTAASNPKPVRRFRNRLLVTAAAVTGLVLLSGFGGPFGFARGCQSPEERQKAAQRFISNRVDDALDDLEATPAQRARVLQLKEQLVAEAQPLIAAHREAKAELASQFAGGNPDSAKLHALVDERISAVRAFAHKLVDAAVEVHASLTPEQKATITGKIKDRMEQ
jgi:Spy/CpxP family protein refolding chaperone